MLDWHSDGIGIETPFRRKIRSDIVDVGLPGLRRRKPAARTSFVEIPALRKYGRETGISAEVNGLCVHSMRATAAANALENEADIAKVQEWLGHRNVSTTRLLRPAQEQAGRQPDISGEVSLASRSLSRGNADRKCGSKTMRAFSPGLFNALYMKRSEHKASSPPRVMRRR
jgi:hypothetical protein